MSNILVKTISELKQLSQQKDRSIDGVYGKALNIIASNYTRATNGWRRSTKERDLQGIMEESKSFGLHLVALVTTTTGYGKYGGSSMFLPEGAYGFAASFRTDKSMTYCPPIPNDSMESCFVAKGYRVMCYNAGLNDTDSFKVTHPGSYDFGWHGFSKKTSSILVEPDVITPAMYNSLEQKADSAQSQLEYQQRQNSALKGQVSSLQGNIQAMNNEVKTKDFEIKQEQTKIGDVEKANQDLIQKNNLIIEESNATQLKTRVVALEHFESMNESFSKHNIYMTIALSALVALLAASMIRISTKN